MSRPSRTRRSLALWLWQWGRRQLYPARGCPEQVGAGLAPGSAWEIILAAFLRGHDDVLGWLPEPILPDFPLSVRLPTNQATEMGLRSGFFLKYGLLRYTLHTIQFTCSDGQAIYGPCSLAGSQPEVVLGFERQPPTLRARGPFMFKVSIMG